MKQNYMTFYHQTLYFGWFLEQLLSCCIVCLYSYLITFLLISICHIIRHRISYLFLITLAQSCQCFLVFSKYSFLCVKEGTNSSQLALLFCSCLCLRFAATLYWFCLSAFSSDTPGLPLPQQYVMEETVQHWYLQTNVSLPLFLLVCHGF